jgi:D-alanyl-D-alanine carboxypeptidase
MFTGRKNAPNSGYHSAQPFMFKLPPFARLGVVVLVAGAGVGILATTSTLPVVSSGVAAAARPQSTPAPAPWFDMNVASADLSFKMPRSMPTGAPPIRGQAGILVDLDTGEILWAKQPDLELAPASLTKVLTALIALENFSPDQPVTITSNALGQSSVDTLMHLKAGETFTVQELLEGMLLPSGDDAASAIAVDTVGEARFVAAMNAQVAALGLDEAHFSATAGLDDPGLYASPYDLAVIAAYTYEQFPLFDQIVDSLLIDLPATAEHPAFQLHNLDALLEDYPAAVGIKPGWTGNAGACLIGMALRGGHHLLAVLMSANYPAKLESRLFDWGFSLDGLPPLLPPAASPSAAPRT